MIILFGSGSGSANGYATVETSGVGDLAHFVAPALIVSSSGRGQPDANGTAVVESDGAGDFSGVAGVATVETSGVGALAGIAGPITIETSGVGNLRGLPGVATVETDGYASLRIGTEVVATVTVESSGVGDLAHVDGTVTVETDGAGDLSFIVSGPFEVVAGVIVSSTFEVAEASNAKAAGVVLEGGTGITANGKPAGVVYDS